MYRALADGDVDVISAFSSDGRIEADRLPVLEDPQRRIPPYDAVVMISPARPDDGDLLATLQPLVGTLPVRQTPQANIIVHRADGAHSPAAAARGSDTVAPKPNTRPPPPP